MDCGAAAAGAGAARKNGRPADQLKRSVTP
jgi:hypothetical protein